MPYGFAQRLSYVYNRKLDVVNRGFSGYNTEWGLPVFRQCLAKRTGSDADLQFPKVQLLTIWFGANDACIPPSPQHVPLSRFTELVTEIVRTIKSPTSPYHAPWTRIIILTAPPVNTYQRGADLAARDPPRALDRLFEVTKQYAVAAREVGETEGVPVVDVWTMLWEACGKEERKLARYLYDGLHVNEEAYGLIYDAIMRTINANWPEFMPDRLPMVFPPWAEIGFDNPQLEKRALFHHASS